MAGGAIFVQLAVQVQAFEHKLDGAGDLSRVALAAELLDRRSEAGYFGRLAHVLEARERVADFDLQAVVEASQQFVELVQGEVAIEDVEYRLLEQLFDNLLFVPIA